MSVLNMWFYKCRNVVAALVIDQIMLATKSSSENSKYWLLNFCSSCIKSTRVHLLLIMWNTTVRMGCSSVPKGSQIWYSSSKHMWCDIKMAPSCSDTRKKTDRSSQEKNITMLVAAMDQSILSLMNCLVLPVCSPLPHGGQLFQRLSLPHPFQPYYYFA